MIIVTSKSLSEMSILNEHIHVYNNPAGYSVIMEMRGQLMIFIDLPLFLNQSELHYR